jgi:hypothetical protein
MIQDNYLYQIFYFASPFIAAILVSFANYYFNFRLKKYEVLYETIIPNIKEIQNKLVEVKRYCNGRLAYLYGYEFPPYKPIENINGLTLRISLRSVIDDNQIFLSKETKSLFDDLESNYSLLCSAECAIIGLNDETISYSIYEKIIEIIEELSEQLNKNLKLPKI